MALTIEQLKNKYYAIVVEKGRKIYAEWGKNTTKSKQIVATANVYAFDKRLKTDRAFRFQVLAFAYALSVRIDKRYYTFLRKLFRLFAFLKERNAIKLLKRVLGFLGDTSIREMIEKEMEYLAILLSSNEKQDTTGGGKRSEMSEMSIEEKLQKFLDECSMDEEQKGTDLPVNDGEKIESQEGKSATKTENAEREKISVEETKTEKDVEKQDKDTKKDTKTKEQEKGETAQKESELSESKKEEHPMEKSVANTSILAEMMILNPEREDEPQSPFPVFRNETKPIKVTKEDFVESKEYIEGLELQAKTENLEQNIPVDTMDETSPFPVFREENKDAKPIENSIDEPSEEKIKIEPEKTVREKVEISEENKVRRALNVTMSKEQIDTIVEKLHETAKLIMEREEGAWREKISIRENQTEVKASTKATKTTQNKGGVKQNSKK